MPWSGVFNTPEKELFNIVLKIVTVLGKKNQDVSNALNCASVMCFSLS